MSIEMMLGKAAAQAIVGTERVRKVEQLLSKGNSTGTEALAGLQKLAVGDLTGAAGLLKGATSALSLAGDLSPKVGMITRNFDVIKGAASSVLSMAAGSNLPLVGAAGQALQGALKDAQAKFGAMIGLPGDAVDAVAKLAGVKKLSFGIDSAGRGTPHLMTMTANDGESFHFNLSTAAFDKLKRATRYKVASQERLNRQEAQQAVSQGGETITLTGVIFPRFGNGMQQLETLRRIGDKMDPVQLTTGYGKVMGRWYLHGIEEEQDGLLHDGAPRKQSFSLEFGRYGEDRKNV